MLPGFLEVTFANTKPLHARWSVRILTDHANNATPGLAWLSMYKDEPKQAEERMLLIPMHIHEDVMFHVLRLQLI